MDERIPEGWGSDAVSEFVETAHQNSRATFANLKQEYLRLESIAQAYRLIGDNLTNTKDLFPAFFLMRAHSCFLAASGLAISGQVYEANSVARACLEASLYGFYIFRHPESIVTWSKRNESKSQMRKVRELFKPGRLFAELRVVKGRDERLASIAERLYEQTIDMGAHPNVSGLASSWQIEDATGGKRFLTRYITGDPLALKVAMKTAGHVGLCSLLTFKHVFLERFDLLGISDTLQDLKLEL